MDDTLNPHAPKTNAYEGRRSARDHIRTAAKYLPLARYVPKNPAFLMGAAAVGVGLLAWRNRETLRRRATPLLADARTRGQALVERLPRRSREPDDAPAAQI